MPFKKAVQSYKKTQRTVGFVENIGLNLTQHFHNN